MELVKYSKIGKLTTNYASTFFTPPTKLVTEYPLFLSTTLIKKVIMIN